VPLLDSRGSELAVRGRPSIIAGAALAGYAAAIGLTRGPEEWILAAPLVFVTILAPAANWLLKSPNAWLTIFFAVALLAPPLPVALGNSGPHPAIAIALVGVVIGLIRLQEWRFERTLLSGALVLFFSVLAISIGPAAIYSGTNLALESLVRVGLAGISAYVFFYVSAGPGRIPTLMGGVLVRDRGGARGSGDPPHNKGWCDRGGARGSHGLADPPHKRWTVGVRRSRLAGTSAGPTKSGLADLSTTLTGGVGGPSVPLGLLCWIAVASATFAILDFYFQFPAPAGFGPQFIWLDAGVFRRAQGLFYEASTLGNFCAFFLVMTAVAIVKRIASRVVLLAGGAILMTALILSYSRSCLLNLGIGLTVLLVLERRRISLWRVALVAGATGAAVTAILTRFFPAYAELYWTRLSGSVDLALASNAHLLSGRLESWQTLLRFLAEHPWHALIGVGYKTLPYSSFTGQPIVADNMYLSILVETGVVGLGALMVLNFAILRAGYRAARSGEAEKSFYGTWIFCFWAGQAVQMFSADLLTFWRVLPVYFWVLAMAVRKSDGRGWGG
jgi:O-Antigen ligase